MNKDIYLSNSLGNKKEKFIPINKNSVGTTYPKMISSSLKKDISYVIKYDLRKSALDWLKELE